MKAVQDKVEEYLVHAKAAESQAAKASDPQLKASFEGVARVYRELADNARRLLDNDDDQTQQL